MDIGGCVVTDWKQALFILLPFLASEGVEYWLGKTDKVKSGSKIEFVLNVLQLGALALGKLFRKQQE